MAKQMVSPELGRILSKIETSSKEHVGLINKIATRSKASSASELLLKLYSFGEHRFFSAVLQEP